MSIDQLGLINRCLGVVLIALYLALAFFVVADLLPGSAIAVLWNGSGAPRSLDVPIQLIRRSGAASGRGQPLSTATVARAGLIVIRSLQDHW
jgi:hypothetical protein